MEDKTINTIIKYEQGDLSEEESIKLFSALIKSGLCWKLQGHYGRTASFLIENKIINSDGEIE